MCVVVCVCVCVCVRASCGGCSSLSLLVKSWNREYTYKHARAHTLGYTQQKHAQTHTHTTHTAHTHTHTHTHTQHNTHISTHIHTQCVVMCAASILPTRKLQGSGVSPWFLLSTAW